MSSPHRRIDDDHRVDTTGVERTRQDLDGEVLHFVSSVKDAVDRIDRPRQSVAED